MRDLENIKHMKICYRNFDDAEVSDHFIDYLAECVKWVNMKDGYNFVKVIFTKNKDLIKNIYSLSGHPDEQTHVREYNEFFKEQTDPRAVFLGNPQIDAPCVAILCQNTATDKSKYWVDDEEYERFKNIAIGTITGIINFEANRNGLRTGNCICLDHQGLADLLYGYTNKKFNPMMAIGIGHPNKRLNPRQHPVHKKKFYSLEKQSKPLEIIKV